MRKMMIAFVVLILSSGYAMAGGQPEASGPVTITFWNGFTGPDGALLQDLVKRFNDSQKDVVVKMDIMGWDILAQKLPPSIATKTAPDMALLIGDTVPQYIANGSIRKLDDYWTASGLSESAYLRNVLDLGVYNGTYYSLPMQFNLIYLFWNKDLFRKAGLDPAAPPASMQRLGEYAVKLTDPARNQYGLGLPVKGAPQYWTSYFWNNGGELFDLSAQKSLLDSPQNVRTLSWIQDLAVKKDVSPRGATGSELENLFMSGKLAMYVNGPWMISGVRANGIDFGISAPPAGTARQQVIGGNIGFVIPSTTSDERAAAAYKFIKYWMSDAVLKEWSLKNGFPAWSENVLKDPAIGSDPVLGAISPLSKLGRAYNPTAFEGISAIDAEALWPMIEAAISGGADPQDAVREASRKIDSIFAEYR